MTTNLTVEEMWLADLRSEIHDTDDFRFKQTLQEKGQALNAIVSKFEQELVAAKIQLPRPLSPGCSIRPLQQPVRVSLPS